MFDAGVDSPLGAVLGLIRSVVAGVEVDGLEPRDAALVVEECAEAERLLGALRVSAAATLSDEALWRREGFRSTSDANQDGVQDGHGGWERDRRHGDG